MWDIGKQYRPRCDAAERGIPFGAILFVQRNFIEKMTGCQPIPIFLLNSYILGANPIFLSTSYIPINSQELRVRLWPCKTGLSPPVTVLLIVPSRYFCGGSFCFMF